MMQLYVALLMTCISEMLRRLASTDLRVEILVSPHYQQSCPPCLIDPPGGPPMTDAIALRPGAAG